MATLSFFPLQFLNTYSRTTLSSQSQFTQGRSDPILTIEEIYISSTYRALRQHILIYLNIISIQNHSHILYVSSNHFVTFNGVDLEISELIFVFKFYFYFVQQKKKKMEGIHTDGVN